MSTVVALLVLAGVLVAVGYPLLRPAPHPPADPIGPAARIRALEERKQAIYAAIRELGFDYRSDKLSEADYRSEVQRLKEEAISIVREQEESRSEPPRGPAALEEEIAATRRHLQKAQTRPAAREGKLYCTQCGEGADENDRFCATCGTKLKRAS